MKLASLIAAVAVGSAAVAAPQPFDVNDLVMMDRVGAPVLSPDGKTVAFTVRSTDYDANKGETSLWTVATDAGSPAKRVDEKTGAAGPQWSADSSGVYFLADHDDVNQLWHLPADDGEARVVSDLPLDINSFRLSPQGDRVLFSADVFMDCESDDALACTDSRLKERADNPATGMVYDRMFVRHWSQWSDGRRAQLFVADLNSDGTLGQPRWLTPGMDGDIPSKPFGSSAEFAFAPDGQSVYFSVNLDGASEPWSTDHNIWHLALDGTSEATNLTAGNKAWDAFPLPSPDGKTLYYLAMSVPGFESDRFAIMALDLETGESREVAPDWDRSASPLGLSDDGKTLYTSADNEGSHALFAIDVDSGEVAPLVDSGSVTGFDVAGNSTVVG
ncbi:MAG TPA: hypothetical protein VK064_02370, partial [Wenzhouxiangella sp.]|nr:hypothetical protein [Wenzhouxiangella sp.]